MGRLFWKFFLSILLAQVAATIAIGGTVWLRDQARHHRTLSLDAGPPAEIMINAASVMLRHGGVWGLREIITDMKRPALFVLDGAGHDLLGRPVSPELRAQVDQALADKGPRNAVRTLEGPDGQHYLAFVPRGYDMGEPPRPEFGRGPPGSRGGPRGGPPPFGYIGATPMIVAGVLASLLFAALLAWYFARPIRALRSAFEAAAAGDFAPRFSGRGPARGDELADLGRDFDLMSAQLRTLMDGQRRLLHDVSHELRSPLARLQAAIGLAHQSPEKLAASLERIERESVRMDRLVGELLTLSRLEASPAISRAEMIDLTEMVEQIADDARFEAGPDGAKIVIEGAGAAISGEPDLLWRAIENVVRNAIKHGDGHEVRIGLHTDARMVHIEVRDRGPGIAESDLASIFEPFFRSNQTHNNVDGHGLGLAIAQRVVHAHGGTITAANQPAGGLRVTISLPITP
jgi:two-component system OmpR family sensor kinase